MSGRSLDALIYDWKIYQLEKGHRFSTDDLLTASEALRACPSAERILDLGSGVGSIGLMVLGNIAGSSLVAVEVQKLSYELAKKTVELNQLQDRVELILGDLRSTKIPGSFELICANPPYIQEGRGAISPNPQRAAARVELHGSVFDYTQVAAACLEPDGVLCLCHSARDPRPEEALEAAGLTPFRRLDVAFRAGMEPMISIWSASRQDRALETSLLEVRDSSGKWTSQWLETRRALGAP